MHMTVARNIIASIALAGAFASSHALAQESAPDARAPVATATPAAATPTATAAAAPAVSPVSTRKRAAAASAPAASIPAGPASTPAAVAPLSPENARREAQVVGDLKDEIAYRLNRARRRFDRGPIAAAQKDEIARAIDRGAAQIATQLARLTEANGAPDAGNLDHLSRVLEEATALGKIAHGASKQIESVRTHDDDTEEALQAISDEVEKIADRAEVLAAPLEEMRDEIESKADDIEDMHGVGILKGKHGAHIGVNTRDERVEFGGGIDVKKGEKVESAVAFGGPVTVAGEVMGDAVAFGGNLHVTESGHVHGDGASFGGRVILDEGGRIDGEKTQVGANRAVQAMIPGLTSGSAPDRPRSAVARLGWTLLRGGAEFLCFFILGLVALVLAPKRVLNIASAVERQPLKVGAIGLATWVASGPMTVLLAFLCLLLVGLVLLPLFLTGLACAAFLGYVALALVVGRRIPSGVIPTNAAIFALGAAVIVVLGMIPFFGWVVWGLVAIFGLGAVILTRFGVDDPLAPAGTLETAA